MKMKFTKMHGAGNDFVMVDDRDGSFPCDGRRIAAIAARRIGVGCEGVILVGKSSRADFSMRFFNPDGSRGWWTRKSSTRARSRCGCRTRRGSTATS